MFASNGKWTAREDGSVTIEIDGFEAKVIGNSEGSFDWEAFGVASGTAPSLELAQEAALAEITA